MNQIAHILVVDDEPDIVSLMQEILEDEGFQVSTAKDVQTARRIRQEARPDIVLLDIWMPEIDGISLLREWQETGLMDVPVIMMSGHGTVETAVEATRLGAYDFIEKPVSISKLLVTLKRALEMVSLRRENVGLRKSSLIEPVGHSQAITTLKEHIKRINQHDATVLIHGEPGSGRTLFAHYIHQHSIRQKGPFIQMRVAGMNAETQLAELLGYHNGKNRLEQANGGTLFIKDITEMDDTVQARLLNSLENQLLIKQDHTESTTIDVRVIAATVYEPEQAVTTGRLREELYYYLNVIPLYIPALHEHCEDIPELLEFYTNFFVGQENLGYRHFSVAAQNRLRHYVWPGNVRELKNLVQRLLILGKTLTIEVDEVEPILSTQYRPLQNTLSIFDLPLREAREQFERAYLEHQLQETGGNVSKVAARVGLERTHLYRKLRSLDIDPKQIKK